jgi:hypothetical protein
MMIDSLLNMTLGMILGMIASPVMMKGIKIIRQRRKVNRILKEISQAQRMGLS